MRCGDPSVTNADPQPAPFLSNTPARPWDRRLGIAIVLLSLAAFALAVPYSHVPWPSVPAFIPAYEAALILNDVITAVLLISQFRQLRALSLLVLGAAYFYDALVVGAHVLSFPGVFAPAGLIGGNDQTTVWLYVFWHAVFPIFVIGYGVIAHTGRDRPIAPARVGIAVAIAISAALLLAGCASLLATVFIEYLHPLIQA